MPIRARSVSVREVQEIEEANKMRVDDFLTLRWEDDAQPLIEPGWNSPVLADPTFLFPSETPDGLWVLFAHTVWGIRRYESVDGLAWHDRGMIVRNAMRPFCRRIDGTFALLYEAYRPFAVVAQILPRPPRWHSRLELRSSGDLVRWTRAAVPIEDEPEWAVDPTLGKSVSNPCLVPLPDAYRLYFSASLSYVPDCGFSEPRYIGAADGRSPQGPFTVRPEPVVDPDDDSLPGVIGAGSMKVLPMDDGFVGLQNKIYRDGRGVSRSALFMLRSEDGLRWHPAREEPLLAPSDGWRASHVYACDCRQHEDGTWYLYYNARDGWYKAQGTERIGRLVGRA